MRGRLWLSLVWLLLARASGAAGTPNSPRRPRSYPHLEGDVRWRRLFSSTHFFLRVDPSGRVQGTRWRHGADSESGEGVQGRQAGSTNKGNMIVRMSRALLRAWERPRGSSGCVCAVGQVASRRGPQYSQL